MFALSFLCVKENKDYYLDSNCLLWMNLIRLRNLLKNELRVSLLESNNDY